MPKNMHAKGSTTTYKGLQHIAHKITRTLRPDSKLIFSTAAREHKHRARRRWKHQISTRGLAKAVTFALRALLGLETNVPEMFCEGGGGHIMPVRRMLRWRYTVFPEVSHMRSSTPEAVPDESSHGSNDRVRSFWATKGIWPIELLA